MLGRRLLLVVAGALVVLTVASVAAVGLVRARNAAGTVTRAQLEWGGVSRDYRLFVPDSVARGSAAGLVVVLHGYTWSVDSFAAATGFDAEASARRWVAVYPAGWHRSWDAGTCCGDAVAARLDDAGFIAVLAASLRERFGVAPGRVYAAGFSNGAMLSLRIACEAPAVFAAVAAVSGEQEVDDCTTGPPVSVLLVHGTADEVVRFPGLVRLAEGEAAADWWARRDACGPAASSTEGRVSITTFDGCAAASGVVQYAIAGGRHEWPRSDPDATAVAAAFLAAHARN